jgi:signal transduction histidine kinase
LSSSEKTLARAPPDADSRQVASVESIPASAGPRVERPGRLLLRLAVYAGVVLAGLGILIGALLVRQIGSHAERDTGARAETVASAALAQALGPRDFAGPVPAARRAQLDRLVRKRVLAPGVVGARLVNSSGTITYAALHRLIGTPVPYVDELGRVFGGAAVRRTTRTTTSRGQRNVKVVQMVIPVQAPSTGKTIGALEIDHDYRTVDATTEEARTRLILILAAGLLALYIALLPILRRATAELEGRNRRLHAQAAEREDLLAAERSARAEAESIQRLLAEQNDRLRELDRMKDEFVSLVSHQLRTPLTSIRGYIELLLEDEYELTPEQLRFLGVVDRNAQRLLDLVGDLLFLAQVDAGRLEIDHTEVDFCRVVRECIEATRPIADGRGVALKATVGDAPPVTGDAARLAQVLDNLVANAIKFTPAGGSVSVAVDAAGDAVVLTVADTGLGISAADLERIFDRFFRSSQATTNAIPGSGLGLAIAKAIVDRHGGRISIASDEGTGTTVRLELPIANPIAAGGDRQLAAAPSRVR